MIATLRLSSVRGTTARAHVAGVAPPQAGRGSRRRRRWELRRPAATRLEAKAERPGEPRSDAQDTAQRGGSVQLPMPTLAVGTVPSKAPLGAAPLAGAPAPPPSKARGTQEIRPGPRAPR